MGRPCASCNHPRRAEIDRKFRTGATLESVHLWLKEHPPVITVRALQRHRKDHIMGGQPSVSGHRPTSTDFLDAVIGSVHERLEAGELEPTIRDGISAYGLKLQREEKQKDRDLLAVMAQVLSGAQRPALPEAIEGTFRELDPEVEEDRELATRLLTAGV